MKSDGLNQLNETKYQKIIKKQSPNSPLVRNIIRAFIVGGIICIIAQIINDIYVILPTWYDKPQMDAEYASVYTTVTMVFLGAFLTMLNIYDNIGKFAGAGSIVPITGFANSIVSPAMEFKSEGQILGVGSQMFLVAGPVLVYGTAITILVGFIYYLIGL